MPPRNLMHPNPSLRSAACCVVKRREKEIQEKKVRRTNGGHIITPPMPGDLFGQTRGLGKVYSEDGGIGGPRASWRRNPFHQ